MRAACFVESGKPMEVMTVPDPAPGPGEPVQLALFSTAPHPALAALRAVQPDELSPLEALTRLYELHRLAGA